MELTWNIKIVDQVLKNSLENVDRIRCESRGTYFVIKRGDEIAVKPYRKICKQFRLPNKMKAYLGKDVKIYKDFINHEEGELFRIESSDFGITQGDPYFTSAYFAIPESYIYKCLDERASVMNVSFSENTSQMYDSGYLHIVLTEQRNSSAFPIHPYHKLLRAMMPKGLKLTYPLLNEFEYEKTLPKGFNHRYGIMVFRRPNGQDISPVC